MTALEITLPDRLAKEAEAAGLLAPEAIARLIEEAVKREAGKRLLDEMQRLRAANVPLLTEEEIAAEVKATRAQRRSARGAGR